MSAPLFPAHSNDVPAYPKMQMTKEDWEQRKGYITKRYIDENKTFPYIRDRLISEGFLVSRRTFTKKILEWGLKKNYSKKERAEILKSEKNIERLNSNHRLTKAKMQRWQKQFGHSQINELSSLVPLQRGSQGTFTYNAEDLDHGMEVEPPITERYLQESSSMVLHQEFPEHGAGSVVDLAQLLSHLGIYVGSRAKKDDDILRREELRAEATSDGRITKFQTDHTRIDSFQHATDAINPYASTSASILYIGIGIFSTSRTQAPRLSWTEYSKIRKAWPREIEQLKAKLQAQALPVTQKISVLQKLARAYFQLHWHTASMKMQQQILAARKSQQQVNPIELLITCLEIVYLHILRKDFRTAAKVHRAIHLQILKIPSPEHPIRLFSSYLSAYILYRQSQYNEGENIIRTVVQIIYGWNNQFSMKALRLLGWFMEVNYSASLADIENSYRFSLNNSGGGNFIVDYDNWYTNARDLLEVLIGRGDYEAGEKLCAYVIKHVGLVHGEQDLDYLDIQRFQAKIWYHQGKLSESSYLLCKLLDALEAYGKDIDLRQNVFYDLALVKQKTGEHLEALKWYRKCLEAEIRLYGLEHNNALVTCGNIGDCYERLGRYEDALKFYGKVAERLRNCFGSEHDSVKRVENEIARTRKHMEKAHEKSRIVEDDEDTNMEDGSSDVNQEMAEEMDCDNDSDCDLGGNEPENIADDDSRSDILQEFDWGAFFDCPTPLFYG